MSTVKQPILGITDTSVRYGGLFRRTLARAVQKSLEEVRAHRYAVPDEVQVQAWHLLRLLFEGKELWEETSQLLIELAPRMEMAGFREDWIPYLETGVELSIAWEDHLVQAKLRYYLGQLCRLISLRARARTHLQASVSMFAMLDNPEEQARSINELAYLAWQRSNVHETIDYAEEALSLLPEGHIEVAMAYSALGLIAMEQEEYERAEAYHCQALKIRQRHGDNRLIAWSLQNLALALMRQAKFPEAFSIFDRAIALLKDIVDLGNLGVVHLNIGLTLHYAGNSLQALEHYANAESIFNQVSDVRHLARLNVNKGLSLYELKKYYEAELCFEQAGALFTELKNSALRLNALDGVIMAKMAQHQHDEANTLLNEAMRELDTLPELPNSTYLTNSFANRKQILEGSRE